MNDRARDVLVDAALRGVRQAKGVWHDDDGSMCAVGALHAAIPGHRAKFNDCCEGAEIMDAVVKYYDLRPGEYSEILERNDAGNDFITIARRVGVPS